MTLYEVLDKSAGTDRTWRKLLGAFGAVDLDQTLRLTKMHDYQSKYQGYRKALKSRGQRPPKAEPKMYFTHMYGRSLVGPKGKLP